MFKRVLFLASLLSLLSVYAHAATLKAYIGYTVAKSCSYEAYTFNDSSKYTGSTKSATHSLWYWPGGGNDTGESVVHTFPSTGTYTVSLVVINTKDLLKDSTSRTIVVSTQGINSSFYIFGRLCQRSELKFINTSTPLPLNANTVSWNFGDGGTSGNAQDTVLYVYQNPSTPTYTVTLTTTTPKGCVSSTSKTITINKTPKANASIKPHCQDSFMTFDASTTVTNGIFGLTYSWTFLDTPVISGKIIKRFYAKDNSYPVKLGVTNNTGTGCSDTQQYTFTVISKPRAAFKYVPVCQDSLASFMDSTTIPYSFRGGEFIRYWTFYDSNFVNQGNPIDWVGQFGPANDTFQYGFRHGGTFFVRLAIKSYDGCVDTITKKIYINPNPRPNFSYKKTCMDSATLFSDSTKIDSGNSIKGWLWYFGDSAAKNKPYTSTLQNPGHVYKKFSYNYPVKLIAISNSGCRDSVVDSIITYPNPVTQFVFDTGICAKSPVSFANNGGLPPLPPNALPDSVARYFWDFGDGSKPDSVPNTTHIFADSGHYHVKFASFSKYGCGDTLMKIVQIRPLPRPSFVLLDSCERDSVQFMNTSKSFFGNLKDSSYIWDFGDSTTTYYVTNPRHVFKYSGIFSVTLHATTYFKGLKAGCSGDTVIKVKVIAGPHTAFTWPASCLNQQVNFVNQTASPRPGQIKYLWDFGDGSAKDTSNSPSHTYTAVKNYHVKLVTIMPSTGCNDSLTQFLPVAPLPKALYFATSRCNDSLIQFTDSSFLPPNYFFKSFVYNFGDGKTDSIPSPLHRYLSSGIYSTKLVVTSTTGCKDSFFRNVESYHVPNAKFGNTVVCAGTPTQFLDSTDVGDSVVTWKWIFSNSAKDSIQNPTHIYHNTDIANAKLTVYTSHGCSSSLSKGVNVLQQPEPTFLPVGGCNNRTIQLYGSQKNKGAATVVSYAWNFRDSTPINDTTNPIHTWAKPGIYKVVLTEVSNLGCVGTDTVNQTVTALPISAFDYVGSCFHDKYQFVDTSVNETSFPIWDLGDGSGSNSALGKSPSIKYAKPGTYRVTMIAQSSQSGCIADTAIKFVIVHPAPIAKYLWDTVCFGNPTKLIDSSSAGGGVIVSRRWYFPHNLVDSLQPEYYTSPDSFLGSEDSFQVVLKVTSNYGCTSSDSSQYVHVKQRPIAAFDINPNPVSIQHPTVVFTNNSQFADPSQYYWDFGDGHDSHDINPTHTYNDTGTYHVVLSSVSFRGCVDTFRYTLVVTPGYSIFAPNIITVNGDGLNDVWRAKGVGVIDFDVLIVDRWGQQVFHSTDIDQAWNADYNGDGVKVPEGVYVFYIKAGNFANTDFTSLKGQITVVK